MPYDPKIVLMPGARLSPEVLLHRTMGKLDSIKNVVVIIQWVDDTLDVDWSQMKVSEVALASQMLLHTSTKLMLGTLEDVTYTPDAG